MILCLAIAAILDTTPAPRSPYYGQRWECVCSKDFYVATDTITVRHVWKNSLVPMVGPDVQCDRMRRVE
jgi:hypothetical protein